MSQRRIKVGPGAKRARKDARREALRCESENALPPGTLKEGIRAGTYTAIITGPAAMVPYIQDGELRTQVRDLGTRKDVSFSQDESSAVNPCIHAVTFILSQFHGADTDALTTDLAAVREALGQVTFSVRPEADAPDAGVQEDGDAAQGEEAEVGKAEAAAAGE